MASNAPSVALRRFFFALTCALAACSRGTQAPLPFAHDGALDNFGGTGAGKIKHVVYIVQENRSFDNLFQGYPGAETASSGKDSAGKTIALVPVSLSKKYELDHSAHAMFADCDGTGAIPGTRCRMNGFDKERVFDGPRDVKYPMYVYVPHGETKPYVDMAHEWVLADHTFASQLDESFVAHQYIIAAQANSSVDVPLGAWGCEGSSYDQVATITKARKTGPAQPPCFDYQTLGDELDKAGLAWRFYTSKYGTPSSGALWSGFQAVQHIYDGPDWANVITPQQRFLTDVAKGKLAAFTWITPICVNSDHIQCGGGYGPSWVTALVNAVGKSRSGTPPRSSCSGTTGAVSTTTSRRPTGTTTAWGSACRCSSSRRTRSRISSRTHSTKRRVSFALPKTSSTSGRFPRPTGEPPHPQTTASTSRRSRANSSRSRRRKAAISSSTRSPTIAPRTRDSPAREHDGMALMFVQKREPLHHPRIEPVARMPRDLPYDVHSIFEPLKLATGRDRKDRGLAILAAIAYLRYVFAIVSETRFSVV